MIRAAINRLTGNKDKLFYSYFTQASGTIVEMAGLLCDMCKTLDYSHRNQLANQIEQLENRNDELTHTIFTQLTKIYLTPISREDIYELAGNLDDVADFIYASSKSLIPIKMEKLGIDKLLFAQNISTMSHTLRVMMQYLEQNNHEAALKQVAVLRQQEHEADDLYELAMKHLYAAEHDFKDFIRSREVFLNLETTADKVEAVANTTDNIIWKHIG